MSSDQQNASYIKFVCTSCNAVFKLPAKYAGRKCKCKCGMVQQVPSMPSDAVMPSAAIPSPKKQQNDSSNNPLQLNLSSKQLVCPVCGEVYSFGKDATILTMENILEFFINSGTAISGSPSAIANILQTPVLVGHYLDSWAADVLEKRKCETRQIMETVQLAVMEGKTPKWQCHICMQKGHKDAHVFPADWSRTTTCPTVNTPHPQPTRYDNTIDTADTTIFNSIRTWTLKITYLTVWLIASILLVRLYTPGIYHYIKSFPKQQDTCYADWCWKPAVHTIQAKYYRIYYRNGLQISKPSESQAVYCNVKLCDKHNSERYIPDTYKDPEELGYFTPWGLIRLIFFTILYITVAIPVIQSIYGFIYVCEHTPNLSSCGFQVLVILSCLFISHVNTEFHFHLYKMFVIHYIVLFIVGLSCLLSNNELREKLKTEK
jgi:hypothetical protein